MPNPYHDKLGRFATKNGGYSAAHVPSGSRLAGRGPKVRPVTKAQRKEAGTGLYAPNRERTAAKANIGSRGSGPARSSAASDRTYREQIKRAKVMSQKTRKPPADGTEAAETRRSMERQRDRIRRNREAMFKEIPAVTKQAGRDWYPDQADRLVRIHKAAGSPFAGDPLATEKMYGLAAAFSPRKEWGANVEAVENYLRLSDKSPADRARLMPRVMAANLKRAERVRVATSVEEIDLALRGDDNKSSAFFDNSSKIRSFNKNFNGNLDSNTIDTWEAAAYRLHPDERRTLLNNYYRDNPRADGKVRHYKPGQQVSGRDASLADDLADKANEAARIKHGVNKKIPSKWDPYLPSAESMVSNGYDILDSAGRQAAKGTGMKMAEYQAAGWIYIRGAIY